MNCSGHAYTDKLQVDVAVLMIRKRKWSDRMSCYLQLDRTLYSKERTFCTFI